ncbi:GNAT family N-acetyltransferase [Paludibacter jiangxiensis]|uniref:Ribosomal protein S18 acetylase RimI n=1 Tax=Paludibacter jiangxiensis TaxID=681398 RepID=A0A161LFC8_9BACT|nr:GNAT family N-acetyltransferase [Paludibacter jiangxiensis]GAT63725.1 ribosomal protein S18 acetylase RimI [Paludibacter jiangxiensis]
MPIQIRPIEEADFTQLIALFQEFAIFEKAPELMTNTVDKMKSEKEYIKGFAAINEENTIIGYATCFFAYYTWIGKSLYMDDLYVKPEYRAQGIGTKLINSIIALAKKENCSKVRWQVSEWNTPAIGFYKSLGAQINETERNCDLMF